MKWVLVVMVLGVAPVKTDLVFPTIGACLEAEAQMRDEYVKAYNTWRRWASKNPQDADVHRTEDFHQKRIGLQNSATCIPSP